MANFGTTMSNLSWNVTNGFLAGAMGAAFDTIQSKLANNGRDQKVKYYWEYEKGGAIYNVAARALVGGAVSALSDVAMSEYKKLIGGKKLDTKRIAAETQLQQLMDAQKLEETAYGNIKVNNGQDCVEAYDDWGNLCHDALMLAIPVAKKVKMSIQKWQNGKQKNIDIQSDHLVWWDTTAL